jgi:predicted ATP-grasp superfamily ATP-dependent carboligase
MNSFDGDTTEPGTAPEPEQLLQPVPEGQRITVMLAAFEGWNDAGEAASDSLRYLNKLWGGKKVASIDADEYYDFQFTRPTVRRTASGERKIKWPSTRIYKASAPGTNVDIIFVQGTEPSYKWRAYTAELLVHAEALHVDYVVLVGALLADVPHSRPVGVTGIASDDSLVERLGFERTSYEGPTGIVGVLHHTCAAAGLPSASLWATVPHYVAAAPNPKVALALLRAFEGAAGVAVEATDLEEAAEDYERQVSAAVASDPEVKAFVERLESAVDEVSAESSSEERIPSADTIARDFQRFLRQRGPEGE